ncbi:hypothetical protein BY996DRAFT_6495315 [Phakopsora pachyrhizi]|nr:hypothetical protein BY996DRAFT_6495315 [Phakopsora pachyrhizi]
MQSMGGPGLAIDSCGDDIFEGRLSGRFILCANCNDGLYNNGTGDQLDVPLGTTAFVSGKKMFEILSLELKKSSHPIKVQIRPSSLRLDVKSNGFGIKVENMEQPRDQLPSFEGSKIKTFPLLWENPMTGNLHLQVHPCGAEKLIIEPLSKSSTCNIDDDETLLFKYGKMIEDLKTSTVTIGKQKICVCSTTEEFSTQSSERLRRTRTEPSGNATWPLVMNLLDLTLMTFKDSSEHL